MATKAIVRKSGMLVGIMVLAHCASRRYTAYNDFGTPTTSEIFEDPTRITIGNETNFGPTLSPNGAYMFYTSDRSGNKDIFVKKTRGGYPSPLTTHPADDFSPVLAPDGQTLAFISRRDHALGAIHILDLKASISKIAGRIDSQTKAINIKDMELRNPAWFPDSRSLIFTARRSGDKTPQIYQASLAENSKPTELPGAQGEHPSVNRSGSQIVYSRQGRIYIYDLRSKKEIPLTEGNLLQDGHPKFGNTDDEVLFIRYADDTNFDQKIDGNDRPSIWSLSISHQITHQNNLENMHLKVLTTARISAYYPSSHAPFLYFSSQQDQTLDVYKLPIEGHTRQHQTEAETIQHFQKLTDDDDKIYLLRHDAAVAQRRGDDVLATQIALRELNWLIELGRSLEARWLVKKIISDQKLPATTANTAKILAIEVEIMPWISSNETSDINPEDQPKIARLENNLNQILQDTANLTSDAKGLAQFVLAEIKAISGQSTTAEALLTTIARDRANQPDLCAKALSYRAQLELARQDRQKSIGTAIELMTRFPEDKTRSRTMAIDITSAISKRDPMAVQKLQSLARMAGQTPPLRMHANYRLAEIYKEQDNPESAINHFSLVINDLAFDSELGFDAMSAILGYYEASGQYTTAESLLMNVQSQVALDAEKTNTLRSLKADFHVRKAGSYMINGDIDLATLEYRKALFLEPQNLDAREGLIDAQLANMTIEKIKAELEQKISQNKNDCDSSYLLAHILTSIPHGDADERIKAINRSIELLQDARQINGQQQRYHGLLGKLYLEKSRIAKHREDPATLAGRIELAKTQLKTMFGFGDPNWLELALDSYLTAYQMTPDRALNKAKLATSIADIYFSNENYHLSLKYYLKRIQLQSDALRQTPREEMLLFRHAGRAAFYTDELKLAELLQIRALSAAEKTGRDIDIAYSLDALALTYREQKKYDKALKSYEQLLEIQTKLRLEENLAGTLINVGYCHFMKSNHNAALENYQRAEQLLERFKLNTASGTNSAIKIDIGGQNSAALGFSTIDRLIQITAFRAISFQALGQYKNATLQLERKLALLETKVAQHKKLGFGAGFLAEERSITLNNLGWLQNNQGQLDESAASFARASDLAKNLRVKNQSLPPRPEWLNLLNHARVELQRQNLNRQSKDERVTIEQSLKMSIEQLEPYAAQGQKEPMIAQAALKSVYAQILSSGVSDSDPRFQSAQKMFQESIILAKKSGLSTKSSGNANLNLDQTAIEGDIEPALKDAIIESQYDFRRTALISPKIAWKYYATRGLYHQAVMSLTSYVESGGTIKDHEETLLTRCIDQLLQNEKSAPQQHFDALRRYFFIKLQSLANQDRMNNSSKPPQIVPLGRFERIAASLGAQDALVTAYRSQAGSIYGIVLHAGKLSAFRWSPGQNSSIIEAALSTENDKTQPQKSIKRLYITTNDPSLVGDIENGAYDQFDIAYVASPDTLPKLHNQRPTGLIPSMRPMSELKKFINEELARKTISDDFSPVIFTHTDPSKIDAESSFLDQPILQAAKKIDKAAVLFGYLGPMPNHIGIADLSRAQNASTEAFRTGSFAIAKQRALESLVYATILKNDEAIYQGSTLALEASLKEKSSIGLARLKQIQESKASFLGRKAGGIAELDSVALAIEQGRFREARDILSAFGQRQSHESATLTHARYLYLLAKLPDLKDETRQSHLKKSLQIYKKFNDYSGVGFVEESIAALLEKEGDDVRSVMNHLAMARAQFMRKSLTRHALRINLKIARILNEIGDTDQAVKLLYPIATSSGATTTNEEALDVLSALATAHCANLESSGCQWAKESLNQLSRRISDVTLVRRANALVAIIESRRLAIKGDTTAAENTLNEEILRVSGQGDREEIQLRLALGHVLRFKGEIGASDRALSLAQSLALKLDHRDEPDKVLASIDLDLTLNAIHRGNFQDAKKILEKLGGTKNLSQALEQNKFLQVTYYLMDAECEYKSGNNDAALAAAKKAETASLNTWRPEAQWRVATLLAVLTSNRQEAKDILDRALHNVDKISGQLQPNLSTHHFADANARTMTGLYLAALHSLGRPTEAFATLAKHIGDRDPSKLEWLQERIPDGHALLLAAEFSTGTYLLLVDHKQALFEHVSTQKLRSTLELPPSIARNLDSINHLSILTDDKTRLLPFPAMTHNGISLVTTTDLHFLDTTHDLKIGRENYGTRKNPSIVGVVIPPTSDSMVKKTQKILVRYYPESHLVDPKKLTETSLLRDFAGHDIQIISIPKFGGYESYIPTKFKLPGATGQGSQMKGQQKNSMPYLATAELLANEKMRSRLTILPQPNQATDVLQKIREAGTDSVMVNLGSGDQDTDTFVLKNFLKNYKAGQNACTALRIAQQAGARYYPGNSTWTNYRIYGSCLE